jgi:YHS domain-containing protein
MILRCSACKKTLTENDPSTTCHGNEGVYFFCNRMCKEKWDYLVAPERGLADILKALK